MVAIISFVILAGVFGVTIAAARPASRALCRVPRLTGLTLNVARLNSAHAGCKLRTRGAPVKQASIQTVERQYPSAGRHPASVTVWLNPFCIGPAAYGPDVDEPLVTPGPTMLIAGFYVIGGPPRRFSSPDCIRPQRPPGAGTVEVMNPSGALVATATSKAGHLVEMPLPAGSYTARGTFTNAYINGHKYEQVESVVIPAGHTVRQDFFWPVP